MCPYFLNTANNSSFGVSPTGLIFIPTTRSSLSELSASGTGFVANVRRRLDDFGFGLSWVPVDSPYRELRFRLDGAEEGRSYFAQVIHPHHRTPPYMTTSTFHHTPPYTTTHEHTCLLCFPVGRYKSIRLNVGRSGRLRPRYKSIKLARYVFFVQINAIVVCVAIHMHMLVWVNHHNHTYTICSRNCLVPVLACYAV